MPQRGEAKLLLVKARFQQNARALLKGKELQMGKGLIQLFLLGKEKELHLLTPSGLEMQLMQAHPLGKGWGRKFQLGMGKSGW